MEADQRRHATVTSSDGAHIALEVMGDGPGIVVLPGSGCRGRSYERLAAHLADAFRVHVMDRRGLGNSGPQGNEYSVERECEDVVAVMRHTGARLLLGHSYGGLIALETALVFPVTRLFVYDPAAYAKGSRQMDWVPCFLETLAEGDGERAYAILCRGSRLAAPGLENLPVWVWQLALRFAVPDAMRRDFVEGLTAVPAEIAEMRRLEGTSSRYTHLESRTLVVAGANSPAYMRHAASTVADTIPGADYLLLKGLDHAAPNVAAPNRVAEVVREFFAARS